MPILARPIRLSHAQPDELYQARPMSQAWALNFLKKPSLVRTDVCRAVRAFLRSEDMLWQVNSTHVVFIPKVSEPHDMTQLQPISLYYIIYRIGAKVVANRLKLVLKYVILDCQSAFVPERLISDNTIVAFELAHATNRRTRMKKGFIVLKLDMSMAYDLLNGLFWNRCC